MCIEFNTYLPTGAKRKQSNDDLVIVTNSNY